LTLLPGQLQVGRSMPLGAHWDGAGVNFAVFSEHAERIELCVFDGDEGRELGRWSLPGRSRDIWHGYLPGAAPGLVYGLHAHGRWQPALGQRFDGSRMLLDPWAREIVGRGEGGRAPRARVVHDRYDWGDDRPPAHPREDVVLYELHVKGFTQRHPQVPDALRGTYAGLAHPAAIAHLQRLGVTSVSLLPVHQHYDEPRLQAQGLVNYWGYNTLGYFCPEPRYSAAARAVTGPGRSAPDAATSRAVRDEFRAMVRALHAAGIEVIIDVVFNHTCESDQHGPTLAWRGLDNASWYRLDAQWPDRYANESGCGNTLNTAHPRVLQFVMDSLRHWASEMHVDGFRFDLAPVLARGPHGFDGDGGLFRAIAQDPLLAGLRLIAEPWDTGEGGYRLGGFPPGWGEWNDRFRDDLRRWWLRGETTRGTLALRLCGSTDVMHRRREPADSVNYIVSHDGFTLRDLVTYAQRRNEANGEGNRDGHAHEHGHDFGVEGETDRADIVVARARAMRALLASLCLAQGTPMLAAGAELGHSQQGNNNPYCQDNETTWIDWSRADESMIGFTSRLLGLRKTYLPFGNFWYEGAADAAGVLDVAWFSAEGTSLDAAAWQSTDRALGVQIGRPGRAAAARALLLLLNGADSPRVFRLPSGTWRAVFDSDEATGVPRPAQTEGDASAAGTLVQGDRRVAAMSVQWLVAAAGAGS
jgi:glycogen operon protein